MSAICKHCNATLREGMADFCSVRCWNAFQEERLEKACNALDKQEGGSHYKQFAIQPSEYCQKNGLKHLESNAIKYITRHPLKGKAEDIRKAIHCLEMLLEIDYADD